MELCVILFFLGIRSWGVNHPTQVEMLHALLHERRGVMQCCVATLDSLSMYETLPLMFDHVKGPYIKDVRKIFWILDPLLPLVRILPRSIVVNLRNLPYYVCFWATPLPPSRCGRPLCMAPKGNPATNGTNGKMHVRVSK